MITRRRFTALTAASAFSPGIAMGPARAQAWPPRPVRLIVPFAAGGPTDTIARVVAERLSRVWGQQMLIENRPGGGGNIANEMVARSEPDGCTVLMGGSSLATSSGLYRSLSYDPINDFAPVAFLCSYSFFMFVPNTVPAKSVKEFIAYAKENKGKLTMASPGAGSSPHLCGELFKHRAGLDMIHVPYRGAGPAMNDLIPGRVHLLFSGGATLENARSGQVQALGYTGAKRAAIAPQIPTIAEDAIPGFEVVGWYALFAPVKTPAEIVKKLHADTVTACADASVVGRFAPLGYETRADTPDQLGAFLRSESVMWTRVIKDAGIAPQD
ncbi:Bug family tripartite tricarboxylate transporter substrate binding protein [Rhodoplanes sp. Z2-YC6860]|uniref:Bug family tripartite tricarboxylate transporter substrate binding protein n=1 Tax=Rhodoplanes sp. Z2-YC6860 TaxID=674703 RepID=UPI00082F2A86|nr:tripartite tricarboxylate transporter substrate binding protein [Rhodoplanes sp. Z2-YC6860]